MKSWFLSVLVVVLGMTSSRAGIPRVMNYQGKVTTADGSPILDGVYNLRLRVFDVASGGTPLWDSGVQLVGVHGGVFEMLMGESPQPALTLPFDRDYWIEVTFAGDTQSPRVRLCSSGYSFMAAGLLPGTEISGAVSSGVRATIAATNTSTAGAVHGGMFIATASSGTGVKGVNSSLQGQGGYGVHGLAFLSDGRGVYGEDLAGTGVYGFGRIGVHGYASQNDGIGVVGEVLHTVGASFAGDFFNFSNAGTGIRARAYATEGTTRGGDFGAWSPQGYAIRGINEATSGDPVGIYCESRSTVGGSALRADAVGSTGTGCGVFGISRSSEGHGVYGWNASTATSVSGYAPGVTGVSSAAGGRGVVGMADGFGTTCGGYFVTHGSSGLGVVGYNTNTTGTTYGVYGAAVSTTGYAVYAAGNFAASGAKSCVVKTSRGPSMLYCMESPENWFEDFGSGVLVNGQAHIEIDPLFLETVTIDGAHTFHVFLQASGPCGALYVIKGVAGFDVVEAGGTSSVPFDYRIVAKRKGFESRRLDSCESAVIDPHLYPEARTNALWSVESLHDPAIRDPKMPRQPIPHDSPHRESPIPSFPGGE